MTTHLNLVSIFLSYAKKDERFLRELETHLSLLKQQGVISLWDVREILPGANVSATIDQQLEQASIILLLVSADFLASNSCDNSEMKRALARHEAGKARVIPLIIRPTEWSESLFGHLSPLPTGGKAITTWGNRDEAFLDVVSGLRRAVEALSLQPASFSRARLPSIWNIPYPRNPYFTGREDILMLLATALHAGQPIAIAQPQVVSGLGGIGKTQIAIEYAYRYYQEYQAVLWVRAGSRDEIVSGFVELATLLQLPQQNEKEQWVIVQAVKDWLKTHENWLLILDNADDLTLLHEFLPLIHRGHILLTTRASSAGGLAKRIDVQVLNLKEGTDFVLRRAGLLRDDSSEALMNTQEAEHVQELVRELGGLPLALDQAGAYLEETRSSLVHYLSLYRTHRAQLLKERGGLVPDHPEPVATTWSLSFEQIERQSKAAADLLRVCAFLQPDFIPEEILREGGEHLGPHIHATASDPLAFDQMLKVLLSYSFIQRNTNDQVISIHRLVQAVLIDNMDKQMQRQWAERVLTALESILPNPGDHRQWNRYERCLAPIRACADLIHRWNLHIPVAPRLLDLTAAYLQERARYIEAEPFYQRALQIWKQTLGPNHPQVVSVLVHLAHLYHEQGKYAQAEPLLQRALEIREQALGPGHPNVASVLNNLAELYREQKKYAEAESLYQRALKILEQASEVDHLSMSGLVGNLANLYLQQGKYIEAEQLYQHSLEVHQQTLEPNDPDIGLPLYNLALLYLEQKRYAEAEPLLQRALHIWEMLEPLHPRVATVLNTFASLYHEQKKYAEAEPLLQRALEIYEKTLGPKHFHVASVLVHLAHLYHEQGNLVHAEPFYQRALEIREQALGLDHPDVASVLNDLAILYYEQKKDTEAELLYQRALEIREQALGLDHPDIASLLRGLATLYYEQGNDVKAESLYQRALQIWEQAFGPNHPDVGPVIYDLYILYRDQNKHDKAELFRQRALQLGTLIEIRIPKVRIKLDEQTLKKLQTQRNQHKDAQSS